MAKTRTYTHHVATSKSSTTESFTVGHNVTYTVTDKKITIEIDRTKDTVPSASGLTTLLAKTGKQKKLEGTEFYLNLVLFKYLQKKGRKG